MLDVPWVFAQRVTYAVVSNMGSLKQDTLVVPYWRM